MKTIKEILPISIQFLEKHKVERARLSAECLLAHFLQIKRIELYMHFDRPLFEEDLAPFREGLKRVITGEPLDYILGEVDFYETNLMINSAVLIPRQETEILLDLVVKQLEGTEKNVLDLCTGSGCLAIGLKKHSPQLNVVAVDLSEEALALAKKNGEKNQVDIEWIQGDLLEPVKDAKFDLILCNPPYVSEEEYLSLDRGVKNFEPKIALVSGPTGYEFFDRLNRDLPQVMHSGSKAFFEIGASQGEGVKNRFSKSPWIDQNLTPDWAGHDRFFSFKMDSF